MKRSRLALFQSVMALLLCFSMLVGTTFAWFTDSVSSGKNVIAAGTLDVELEYLNGDTWTTVNENTKVLDENALWEPGYTEVAYLRVTNAGSLALKYALGVGVNQEKGSINAAGEAFYLSDYIRFGVIESETEQKYATREAARSALSSSKIISEGTVEAKDMLKGNDKVRYVTLVVYMPEDVGNAANYATGVDAPEIQLGIQLVATQTEYESDSFGMDYDKTATLEGFHFPGTRIESSASSGVETDGENKVSEAVKLANETTSALVPAGVLLDAGTKALTLEVSDMDKSQANVVLGENEAMRSLNVHVNGVSKDNTVPMEITIKEAVPVGLNLGNYKFYHVEDGKTAEMTYVETSAAFTQHNQFKYDPATGDITLNMATFSEVALVADTENAWNGTVATGFAAGTGTEADPYLIANADQFVYFGDLISDENDNYGSKHYKLVADINLGGEGNANNGFIFYPVGYHKVGGTIATVDLDDAPEAIYEINEDSRQPGSVIAEGDATNWYTYGGAFKGTFDGAGHTVSNIYQNTWQLKGNYDGNYWNAAMGVFGYVNGGTVKNLTVDNFSSDGEFTPTGVIAAYAAGDSSFENIAITKCNPRVYNTGNGGIIGIAGDTRAANDDHITLKNITVDNSNKISALWGSWDVACGGLVGMYRGNVDGSGNATGDTISFENCHVSAIIDVYNDVCANYQYYAYRYAGMMIGSVRHNTTNTEGKTIPNMAGISAKSCTANFGTWNDYYYCEIIDNTTASYTHDYQMSRLVEIKAINGTTITYLDGTTGTVPASGRANYVIVDYTKGHGTENATCYHFKDGTVWTHDMGGIQTGIDENGDGKDDLKEDKQHLYLEFNNLFTGYGWGVSSMGINNWNGITALGVGEGKQEKSVEKFKGKVTELANNKEYKLSDVFTFVDNGVKLVPDALTVTVTNKAENNPVSATIVYDRENWENGTLALTGTGEVTITIQDYYFCTPTTITVNVTDRQPEEKFDVVMNNGDFLHRVGNSGTVALDKLFKAKDGVSVGTVSVTVEAVNGSSASGTYSNNAIQFSDTGVVKVTIKDDDTYCIPTVLYLEVVDAVNATSATSATSNNVVLLNDCGLSSLTVSGRYAFYGNGFTMTYTGNGQYLNNGLKLGVVTVSENGMLDNVRIKATIYPRSYLYYGSTAKGDYVQGGPSSVEGDKTRYHYQLSAVAASGNATISNCYIYGGRNNIFVNTGDVTIQDTILESGTVANVQIQSNNSHTVTFENVTTIQKQVHPTIDDTSKTVLGAAVIVGPETNTNPKIVMNGSFKQYNWVTAADKNAVSDEMAKEIIGAAVGVTEYNHTINGQTASNLGIIYLNSAEREVENNTGLPYVGQEVSLSGATGYVYSIKGATEGQIYNDTENADKNTVNGAYEPQFKYDDNLGGQYIAKTDDGDEFCYREGDTIKVMFPTGSTKELDLAGLVNITKYSGQNLNLNISCKDNKDNAVTVTNNKITLTAEGAYTVTYTVTDKVFYDKDGNMVGNGDSRAVKVEDRNYSWNVTLSVSLKDKSVPNASFVFDKTKQIMGYGTKSITNGGLGKNNFQYIPFLAGLQIYDYNGQETYLRFDGNTNFDKVANVSLKCESDNAYITVTLTDGGVINVSFFGRADNGSSTKTGTIQTNNNTIYYLTDGDTSATTTTWTIKSYSFVGYNGVEIVDTKQVFSNCVKGTLPLDSFSASTKYTVTYDANGGNCVQGLGYTTSASASVSLPLATRSGYVFKGWYTAASGGTRVGGLGDNYTPSANITLYAQWAEPFDVMFNYGTGTVETRTYRGTPLTLPSATNGDKVLKGWYDAASGGNRIGGAGDKYTPSAATTLYAQWQNVATVTYNATANGGSCATTSATFNGTDLILPTPNSRTGYTFNGWYTAASGGTKIGDAGAKYSPENNITLYAQWTINSYTIKVTSNGATVKVNGTNVNNNKETSIEYGTQVTVEVSYSYSKKQTISITGADGTTYSNSFTMPAQTVTINASSSSCVTGDTLVTMADGTQKRVDAVTYADQLLVWNFYTGEYAIVPAALIQNHGYAWNNIIKLAFSDGTVTKAVNEHGYFDTTLNEFVMIRPENAKDYVGHEFVKADGDSYTTVTLVKAEVSEEYVEAYSILTAYYYNFITDNLFSLTSPVIETNFFMPFEVGENMSFDAEKMAADIEKYGLYEYADFEGKIPYEVFECLNIKYLKVAVGKGLVTYDQITELLLSEGVI